MKRRTFLGTAGATIIVTSIRGRRASAQNSALKLTPFVDPLPIPPVLAPNPGNTSIAMTQFQRKLHRDLPPTTLWGYGGSYPGPTIETTKGKPVFINWQNNLPAAHLLSSAIDRTLHGGAPGAPDVRTVVHLHGIKVLPESDGYPDAWFSPGFGQVGPAFASMLYTYPNDQQACTLWYHDHAIAITRLNVYAGLTGMYIIRDNAEAALKLPSGPFEIPLIIQDRSFNADGSLLYPINSGTTPPVPPVWVPEFFGDRVLVNGKVFPFLSVEPRRYRFRILNASNARFYHMTLVESGPNGRLLNKSNLVFQQIGTDGGLLPAPVTLKDVLIAPAERFDVILDFTGLAGKSFVLTNDGAAPFPGGGDVVPGSVMQFRVNKPLSGPDQSTVPKALVPITLLSPKDAVKTRDVVLTEADAESGDPIIGQLDNAHWDDPVIESPKQGTIEVWRIINATGDAHPIHVHLVQFQVLDRQPFDVDAFAATGKLTFTGPPVPPDKNERPAHKDVVKTYPGLVTRIIARFDLPAGTNIMPGLRYRYVWHCHILEHEDNEMMRPYDVVG
jgi:spore coat protein A